jgi:hypothetical protein
MWKSVRTLGPPTIITLNWQPVVFQEKEQKRGASASETLDPPMDVERGTKKKLEAVRTRSVDENVAHRRHEIILVVLREAQ